MSKLLGETIDIKKSDFNVIIITFGKLQVTVLSKNSYINATKFEKNI
jgi:hypothetical protein